MQDSIRRPKTVGVTEKQLQTNCLAPIPFRFTYFCFAFPVNRTDRTIGVLDGQNNLTRCLYFDSPYGLVKIQHNSKKYSAILQNKTSNKIYEFLTEPAYSFQQLR